MWRRIAHANISSLASALLVGVAVVLAVTASVQAQAPSPAAKSELAPTGKLRVAFPVNALTAPKNATTGELGGLVADLGREIARRLDVSYEPVEFASPHKFIEAAGGDVWDVTLMSPDPVRAKVADWSAAIFELDYAFLVPPGSKLTTSTEVDQPGIRVGAVRGDAQELAATRILKHAEMVRFDGWPATMAALREGRIDAVAGNRVTTPNNAKDLPGSWLLDDRFGKQELALFVRKDRPAALAYVDEFVKQAIASGLVQKIIERSGRPGLKVASE